MVAVIRSPEAPGFCATASVGASASQANTQQFMKLNHTHPTGNRKKVLA
jgi:hypothetical protein